MYGDISTGSTDFDGSRQIPPDLECSPGPFLSRAYAGGWEGVQEKDSIRPCYPFRRNSEYVRGVPPRFLRPPFEGLRKEDKRASKALSSKAFSSLTSLYFQVDTLVE